MFPWFVSLVSRAVPVSAILMVGALALTLALPAQVNAALPAITFDLAMYGDCVAGNAAANATVTVVWRDASGRLKTKTSVPSDSYGGWHYCSEDPGIWVAPKDRLKVMDGTNVRDYRVPKLTIRVDRVSDLVTGAGPAGRTLRLCYSRRRDYDHCHSVRIGADGHWAYAAPSGMDGVSVFVRWTSPNGDALYMVAVAQSLSVMLGKAEYSGESGTPRTYVRLAIDGGARALGETPSGQHGEFSGEFFMNGGVVPVAAGDRITSPIATDEDWIVPNIEAIADRFNDTVSGRCEDTGTSSRYVEVEVLHSGHHRGSARAHADENGYFTADFREPGGWLHPTNIIRDDRLVISCFQVGYDVAQLKIKVR